MHSRGVTATPLRVVTASPPRVCIILLIIEWLIVNHSLLKGFPHFSNNDSKQYIVMWHKLKGQHNLPHTPQQLTDLLASPSLICRALGSLTFFTPFHSHGVAVPSLMLSLGNEPPYTNLSWPSSPLSLIDHLPWASHCTHAGGGSALHGP